MLSFLHRSLLLGSMVAACCAAPLFAQQPEALYHEPYRPQVHFSPEKNWTNDPNGLVFFDGEYHLFFQYNPSGDTWGHMSWGHAVSSDLVHWKQLPLALPEHDGEMIFTGSIVIDEHNTSGFCQNGQPCMVAVYTSHRGTGEHDQRETQSLAYSLDRGRTWSFYDGNPVLDREMTDFRDPSVTWNDEAKQWLMAVSLPNEHKVVFYQSADLKHWTEVSTFGPSGAIGGQWECPDLIHLPATAQHDSLWVLKVGINPGALQGGSGEQYFLGSFDGRTFTQQPGPHSTGWSDYGKDSYCAISYNHLPANAAPVLLGWMDNWQYADKLPTSPWRGQMTLPRELSLQHDSTGDTLAQQPILTGLRSGRGRHRKLQLSGTRMQLSAGNLSTPTEMLATFTGATDGLYGLRFYSDNDHWVEVGFDEQKYHLYVDRTHSSIEIHKDFPARTEAPLEPARSRDLHLVLDRSSLEVFAQNGTLAMTNLLFPASPYTRVQLFRSSGHATLRAETSTWTLNSLWK